MSLPRFGLLLATLCALAGPASADAPKLIRTAGSGPWSAPATWEGARVPAAGDRVLVRPGHAVTYDVAAKDVIRAVHVAGVLTFAPDRDTELNVGLLKIQHGEATYENGFDCPPHQDNKSAAPAPADLGVLCTCCDGKPSLFVGTPDRPIDARHKAVVRLHFIPGMDQKSCPAILCCGGRMDFHGAPLGRTWVNLGEPVPEAKKRRGDEGRVLTLSEPVTGWKVGDRVIVTGTTNNIANDHGPSTFRADAKDPKLGKYRAYTEERVIRAVDGDRLTLDEPLAHGHLAEDDYRAEVANLSRNVVVESADPGGVRGHTMYHRGSSGSVSYAEFRHLGKEGVLGRYALHFHLCGDGSRGSSVVGASVWDSHNRWLTVHGTNYLVVRDCVGYKSVGHGFFLEDGTEVYNVFDRNLAVHAYRGRPLPDQMLPFDKNEGAGFWWANSHNTFTRNVACECDQYGYRFEATPKKGIDLTLPVRQPDGGSKFVDVRTLPFVRFEGNEAHSLPNYGLNLGEGIGGVGPDADHPFVMRDLKIWKVRLGYRPAVPHVLLEKARLHGNTYGIYLPDYVGHDYRDVTQTGFNGPIRQRRMPGVDKAGDGAGKIRPAEEEVARLDPVDDLPPTTVITHVTRAGDGQLLVQGTTADNGTVKQVLLNGRPVEATRADFAEWRLTLPADGTVELAAHAVDAAGNAEPRPHRLAVRVR